jgi:hypothetical protein
MSRKFTRAVLTKVAGVGVAVLLVAAFGAPALAKGKPAASPTSGSTTIATKVAVGTVVGRAGLPSTPGSAGLVYVVQGDSVRVSASFTDDAGVAAPLSTNKAVTATLTVTNGPDQGTTDPYSVPAGATTAAFEVTLADAANNVVLEVSAPTGKHTTISGDAAAFDVLLESDGVNPNGRTSIGGEGNTGDFCDATSDAPVCGDLFPPAGLSFGADGLISRGVCQGLTECTDSFVQALVTFQADPYNPATLVMTCDKTLCGHGAIKAQTLKVQLTPGTDPVDTQPCTAKGVAIPVTGTTDPFCVDYVQSTRDNAGDTHLYLLFTEDAKVRFP